MPNVDPNAETAVSDTQASGGGGTAATLAIGARLATSELLRDEVRLAQRVTHPNVCRTYDLEEVDGLQLVKMEYVPGEPLSRVLAREGRLSIDRATVALTRPTE